MALKIKRVYAPAEKSDGVRMLVDRLWPRGISREKARIDEWMKEIAPSTTLRKRFHHQPERWEEFRKLYRLELEDDDKNAMIRRLRSTSRKSTVTLLFAAKDEEHNNAVALASIIRSRKQ